MSNEKLIEQIKAKLAEDGITAPIDELKEKVEKHASYHIPDNEIVRLVTQKYQKLNGVKPTNVSNKENAVIKCKEVNTKDQFVTIRAKVVDIWDNEKPSIAQVGLIGDETAIIKFTSFAKSKMPMVEKGKSYEFQGAITDIWPMPNGKPSIRLASTSKIVALDEDIEAKAAESTFTGVFTTIINGSGLLKRCPECNQVLVKGACSEHGKQSGEYDIRIKGVLDNGKRTEDILMDAAMTTKMTGMSVEQAVTLAREETDPGVVAEKFKLIMLGKYFTAKGREMSKGGIFVSELIPTVPTIDYTEAKKKLEAL